MKKGFTIIEVIVTFVILSILIFFAIYTFRYSIANVQRATFFLPKKIIAFSVLDRVISGTYYYVIEKQRRIFKDFFYATNTSFTFFTVSPPYGETLTLAKIFFENNKLILKYEPFYNKQTNIESPKFTQKAKKLILFNQVTSVNISYILKNKNITTKVSDEIPKGIVFKLTIQNKKYHLVFVPLSNFYDNKAKVYHEKYQL